LPLLKILREEYRFYGYIHAKAIPGADEALITRLGMLVDRMSVNIEMPSQLSLRLLAPDKSKESILKPMELIKNRIQENSKPNWSVTAMSQICAGGAEYPDDHWRYAG
jgi:predicted DNA-binding helix-hairpin-helix protein